MSPCISSSSFPDPNQREHRGHSSLKIYMVIYNYRKLNLTKIFSSKKCGVNNSFRVTRPFLSNGAKKQVSAESHTHTETYSQTNFQMKHFHFLTYSFQFHATISLKVKKYLNKISNPKHLIVIKMFNSSKPVIFSILSNKHFN